LRWSDAHFGYRVGSHRGDLSFDRRDNASGMPKSVVVDTAFTWGDDRPPRTPWRTRSSTNCTCAASRCSSRASRTPLRGTFLALSSPKVIELFAATRASRRSSCCRSTLIRRRSHAGRTQIAQLLGLQHDRLSSRRIRPISRARRFNEFKTMVKQFHEAGIEVMLDVVYNHTAEGNQDRADAFVSRHRQPSYYRLASDPRFYDDVTGTGNSRSTRTSAGLQLVMDSLRYWVDEMHVDGFRFDLATELARTPTASIRTRAFCEPSSRSGALARQAHRRTVGRRPRAAIRWGSFPPGWSEWNDKFRDA
jgi:isoamylase